MSFFKKQSINLKKILKEEGCDLSLGAIQEILAKSYGYKNKHVALNKQELFNEAFKHLNEEINELKVKIYIKSHSTGFSCKSLEEGEWMLYDYLINHVEKQDFLEAVIIKKDKILKKYKYKDVMGYKVSGELAEIDYANCFKAFSESPEILKIVFKDLKNPVRPKLISELNLNYYSGSEQSKIRICYDIWNGTGNSNYKDLSRVSTKDKKNVLSVFLGLNKKYSLSGDEILNCNYGLYKIFWKEGGYSLASIGGLYDGQRWLAPTNWTASEGKEFKAGRLADHVESILKIESIESR